MKTKHLVSVFHSANTHPPNSIRVMMMIYSSISKSTLTHTQTGSPLLVHLDIEHYHMHLTSHVHRNLVKLCARGVPPDEAPKEHSTPACPPLTLHYIII